MKERQLLADIVQETLLNIDNAYKVEQRLRQETFDASPRQKRIKIMGQNSTYAEVLFDGVSFGRNTGNNGRRNRTYTFRVNVWYGYKDSPNLASSSQAVFDTIVSGEDGLLVALKEKGSTEYEGSFYYIDEPEAIQASEVALSGDGKELAHYLTFSVNVRKHT